MVKKFCALVGLLSGGVVLSHIFTVATPTSRSGAIPLRSVTSLHSHAAQHAPLLGTGPQGSVAAPPTSLNPVAGLSRTSRLANPMFPAPPHPQTIVRPPRGNAVAPTLQLPEGASSETKPMWSFKVRRHNRDEIAWNRSQDGSASILPYRLSFVTDDTSAPHGASWAVPPSSLPSALGGPTEGSVYSTRTGILSPSNSQEPGTCVGEDCFPKAEDIPPPLVARSAGLLSVWPWFSDHMVLQSSGSRIWGNASALQSVSLRLLDLALVTTADANGHWTIDIPAVPSNTVATITLRSGGDTIVWNDVAFGEVILCSGQSNMDSTERDVPTILRWSSLVRFFKFGGSTSVIGPSWVSTNDNTVGLSTVCLSTGLHLASLLNLTVPIGLIGASCGGTYAHAWVAKEALAHCTHLAPEFALDCNTPICNRTARNGPAPPSFWDAWLVYLLPLRFRLALWYQGESNSMNPALYACHFPALIADWRRQFDLRLPFFYVELPGYPWFHPHCRSAQREALKLPDVHTVTAIDLGSHVDIHPPGKELLGRRLALRVGQEVFNLKLNAVGPVPIQINWTDSTHVAILFENADGLHFAGSQDCARCCRDSPIQLLTASGRVLRPFPVITGRSSLTCSLEAPFSILTISLQYDPFPECVLYNRYNQPAPTFLLPMGWHRI